jgi:hypothetical protein
MNTIATHHLRQKAVRPKRVLVVVIALLTLLGLVQAESYGRLAAYLIVVLAAVLPSLFWLRMGAPSIPILPAVGFAYMPYYAWPILSSAENTLVYSDWEIVRAAITVALFLIMSAITWRLMMKRTPLPQQSTRRNQPDRRVIRFIAGGLFAGVLFHLGLVSGWLGSLGSFFGLARSIAMTFAAVACFLAGIARAQGILLREAWVAAIVGIATLIMLSWSSLFLVGGLIYALAVGLGYVAVAGRVPLRVIAAFFVVVTILHAGKGEMRARYWARDVNYGQGLSIGEYPAFAAEWIGEGITTIAAGQTESVLNRVSLLQMILRVQRATPNTIDYLRGETYAMLPSILVPRFIKADKPASQVGMDLLSIRYGVLTVQGASITAVGWGLVAEAYANFGYLGVIGLGCLLGTLCASLGNWSARAPVVSLPTLMSIATMIALVNLEADFVSLCSTLFQQVASVLILYAGYRSLAIREPGHAPSGPSESSGAPAVA